MFDTMTPEKMGRLKLLARQAISESYRIHVPVRISIYRVPGYQVKEPGQPFILMSYYSPEKTIYLFKEGCEAAVEIIRRKLNASEGTCGHETTKKRFCELVYQYLGEGLAHEACHLADHQRHPSLYAFFSWLGAPYRNPRLRRFRWMHALLDLSYMLNPLELHARRCQHTHSARFAAVLKEVLPEIASL